jgi:hypothetical protein
LRERSGLPNRRRLHQWHLQRLVFAEQNNFRQVTLCNVHHVRAGNVEHMVVEFIAKILAMQKRVALIHRPQ